MQLNSAKIKQSRAKLGLTQQQCADKSKMSRVNWANIEGGRKANCNCTLGMAGRIAEALGCKLGEIVTDP